MITSTSNKQVRYVSALIKKAKTRREEDLFVAEGLRLCSEIPADRIRALYISESFRKTPECRSLTEKASQVEVVSDEVFHALSDTMTPQGVLALVRQYHYTPAEAAKTFSECGKPAHLIILERLQDPGNLGTIIRTGEGAGVTGILMDADTADIYNPKVIRSTMGSIFRVPFACVDHLQDTLAMLKKKGIRLCAAHLQGKHDYDMENYTRDIGFLIGNEAHGLKEETASLADAWVRIPMSGQVESLNAAVAASVLMFEAARQRRHLLT